MSWVKSASAAALLGAGLLLSGVACAAIVVASSGPSASQFPAGKKLGDNDRITLQKGDSVTVLDQRGTKVLRGPGRLAVSQPGRPLPNPAYAVLTRKDAASRARTGAVRTGEDGKPVSPNLWYVDAGKPGNQCITAPDAVRVWRGDSSRAARYRITSAVGAAGTVSFAADASMADWDTADAPVSDGASYTFAREGGASGGTFKFVVLADPPAEPEALALVLIDKGCTAQLDLLSKTLAISRF
jgi:hypothetical protein